MRRSRHYTKQTDIHGQLTGAVSISERPASVEDRAVPGHWKGDLLIGSSNSQITKWVERQDRGKEMAAHKQFTLATDIQVYFCDPRGLWQRGSNENTMARSGKYVPKGIDISGYSQAKLNAVARQLNERPRRYWATRRRLRCSAESLHRPVESAANIGCIMAPP